MVVAFVAAASAALLLDARSADAPAPGALAGPADAPNVPAQLARLPLRFEENAGQWDERVRFVTRQGGTTLSLSDDGMTFRLRDVKQPVRKPGLTREEERAQREKAFAEAGTAAVTLKLVGARKASLHGENELVTKSNFFLGNDRTKWRTGVANYAQVRATGWARGVDVVWHGGDGGLEYDIEVEPGVDASDIDLVVSGASSLDVTTDGALVISTPAGDLVQKPPRVRQAGRELPARYLRSGKDRFRFSIQGYDTKLALLIDPALAYSSCFGGTGADPASAIAIDAGGHAFVTGSTWSTDFPTQAPLQPNGTPLDAFVAKLTPAGTALVYATYLGGRGMDSATSIAIDATGNAYVVGSTLSTNFPTQAPLQAASADAGAEGDAFVTKLDATGSALLYSTYLGGSGVDAANGVAVDAGGSAYVTGATSSSDFPTSTALQPGNAGGSDAFVSKLDASGSALLYSTYLGGTVDDSGAAIAVDGSGNAYVTGRTVSTDFPVQSPLQATRGTDYFHSPTSDAFVSKLIADGSGLSYSTYLGGSSHDFGAAIALDGSGNAYITGSTLSDDFPTQSAVQTTNGGAPGSFIPFVTKLNVTGSALVYSTYFLPGGFYAAGAGKAIAVDTGGAAFITGSTTGNGISSPIQPGNAGGSDAFVAELSSAGAIAYLSDLGGSSDDSGNGIAVDTSGDAYVAGDTYSTNFPTLVPPQGLTGCAGDAFVSEVADRALGAPCTAHGQCQGNLCVDGVCCATPCADVCAACNVEGHRGTCTAVSGAPHGARTCGGSGVCAAGSCDGTITQACTGFPTSSATCGTACSNGIETDNACDGKGSCVIVSTHPCGGFRCTQDGTSCVASCTDDTDCVDGFVCSFGKCVPGTRCVGDHTARPPSGPDQNCSPYKCNAGCMTTCQSVSDCAAPAVCDPSGHCVAPTMALDDSGCSSTGGSPGSWPIVVVAAGAVAALLGRRRLTQPIVPPRRG
jgi:hypothetical protein